MAIYHILDKTKDVMKVVKDKTVDLIDKGNHSLKKFVNTKDISFISSPVIAGFQTKKAFYENANTLLFPIEEFEKELITVNTIFRIEDDEVYYVIKKISENKIIKVIENEDKTFEYECYQVSYFLLSLEFEKEVRDLHLYALTIEQENLLNDIRNQINSKAIVVNGRKSTCLDLWVYFVRCIQLHLHDHYTILAFTKLAESMVEDFASKVVKLFLNK